MTTRPAYPKAATLGQPEVRQAVRRFFLQPAEVQEWTPLLYWLLGSGTPPYKQSYELSWYTDGPSPVANQQCSNCRFAWANVDAPSALSKALYICSQIRGEINPAGWCKLWENWAGQRYHDG